MFKFKCRFGRAQGPSLSRGRFKYTLARGGGVSGYCADAGIDCPGLTPP